MGFLTRVCCRAASVEGLGLLGLHLAARPSMVVRSRNPKSLEGSRMLQGAACAGALTPRDPTDLIGESCVSAKRFIVGMGAALQGCAVQS